MDSGGVKVHLALYALQDNIAFVIIDNQQQRIGLRLKSARERAGLKQDELASLLGLQHRQSLASIEAGERRLQASELLQAVAVLKVDLDYFTDAFRLVPGEARFSFRATPGLQANVLDAFEERAGRWIATYRELGAREGAPTPWLAWRLDLSERSSYEEAQEAAESLVERWALGTRPAESLRQAMEKHLEALVLMVDAPPGISGAASRLPGLNTVLVNRQETEGRRHYDLAHELFHILTWDVMPPDRREAQEVPTSGKKARVEQLADNFAKAALMPRAVVVERWESRDQRTDIHDWLNETASDLRVSSVALMWRLRGLELLSKSDQLEINRDLLAVNGGAATSAHSEPAFSAPFVARVHAAMEAGRLSVKRAASLLGLTMSGLAAVLREHGVQPAFDA